ncbi:MAG: DUF1552 domain-containing protein [Polyangiales bacterium]
MKLTSSRRLFLTGAGGAALALPFLPSLLPRRVRSAAKADAPAIPRRFVAMKTYNGMPVQDWYPRVAPPGYDTHGSDGTVALSQILPETTGRHSDGGDYSGRWAPLSDFAESGVSNILSRALNPFLDSMLLFRGLDFMPGLNHNYGGYLGNFGLNTNGTGGAIAGAQINATMDHVMAASSCVYPTTPAGPRVLHVGSRRNASSYAPRTGDVLATGEASIEQAQSFINPRAAFQATFGSFMGDGDEPNLSARLVDRVIEDYRRALTGPNIGAEDRVTLERHIAHLSDLEERVNTMEMNQCELRPPADVDTGGEFSVEVAGVTALFENMVDLVALALSCDATRVVTLDVTKMLANDGGDIFGIGDSENANNAGRSNWHLLAHEWSPNAQRWLGQGAQWVAENVVARLLGRLQEVTESDGESLLHHSMLLWSNELSFNHLNYSMPTALWGRGGGTLKTGRFLDFVDYERSVRFSQHGGNVIEGVQYNRLLVTIMQAMGMTPADYEREAGRGFGEYRTIAKGDGFARDYDESNVGEALPDIWV